MSNELLLPKTTTGLTLYGEIVDYADRAKRWNGSAFVDRSSIADADWGTGLVAFTEDPTSDATDTVNYLGDWPAGITTTQEYWVIVRRGNTPAGKLEGIIAFTPTYLNAVGAVVALAGDVYTADIQWVRDASTDEYTVTWFKNDDRITNGITSPTIQVIKRADGTDLVAATAMTEVGSSASYKYDASSQIDAQESAIVVVTATIDGSTRNWARIVTRV